MKEVIILILLLTLFQTFVLLYCCKNNNNNYKHAENYNPLTKSNCYKYDNNGNLILDRYGKLDSRGIPSYNPDCYCVSHPDDLNNCPADKL
jgi:hypothetical protein